MLFYSGIQQVRGQKKSLAIANKGFGYEKNSKISFSST